MWQCIYSLEKLDNMAFSSQEHVIPAAIGGRNRLPRGYVSDATNNMFSELERSFAREAMAIPRMIVGPGKRGSLTTRKATISKISVMEEEKTKEICLGYISLGKPYIIQQIHFLKGSHKAKISHLSQDFFQKLNNYDGNYLQIIEDSRVQENEYILGFHDKKCYLAIKEGADSKKAKVLITLWVKELDKANKIKKFTYAKKQQKVCIKNSFNLEDDYFRVLAKIGFNCLAYVSDANFVLDKKFDPVREAIYTGNNIYNHIDKINRSYKEDTISTMLKNLDRIGDTKFGLSRHVILIFSIQSTLKAQVYLYGSKTAHFITLAEDFRSTFIDGIICDWENEKEQKLSELLC